MKKNVYFSHRWQPIVALLCVVSWNQRLLWKSIKNGLYRNDDDLKLEAGTVNAKI